MNRALEVVGNYKYSAISDNCIHMANYISHSEKTFITLKNSHREELKRRRSKRKSNYIISNTISSKSLDSLG